MAKTSRTFCRRGVIMSRDSLPASGRTKWLWKLAGGLVVLAASAGLCQAAGFADLTPDELAEQYVEQFCSRIRAEKLAAQLSAIKVDDRPLTWGRTEEKGAADEASRRELSRLLTVSVGSLADQVEEYNARPSLDDTDRLRGDWLALRKQRNRWDVTRAALAGNQPGSRWLALFGRDTWWFWLSGALAIGCLAFVSWHDRRHEYRRALNGAKARAYGLTRLLKWTLYLMIAATLVAVFGGKHLARWFGGPAAADSVRTKDDMAEELVRISQGRADAELQLEKARKEHAAKREQWLSGELDGQLREQWRRLGDKILKCHADLALAEVLRQKVQDEKRDVTALAGVIRNNQDAIARLGRLKWAVSGGMGIGLTALILVLGFLLLASIQRRDHLNTHTCPMCLGRNTLELDGDADEDRLNAELPMLRCTGRIGDTECPFTFRPFYQELDKIYFPTLGVARAGKTHWLAMVYRELNAGRYTADVQFEKVESSSSEEFDRIVRAIVESRINPSRTSDARLPYPLIFNFCDNDRWGKSNLLVNVFDYSGEVTQGTVSHLNEAQRRRALRADGYLFFLDPTEPRDIQEEGLNRFRRDLRVVGNVRANRSIRAPVALCVSKIDLLAKVVPDFVDYFHRELRKIDPTGRDISMRIIEARSKLTRELRDVVWPGWNIEGLIRDLFGGRYMFFPLTPVSLDNPDNLSPDNLKDRQIDPFGIVEPLVWLLHMNGYPTLKEESLAR